MELIDLKYNYESLVLYKMEATLRLTSLIVFLIIGTCLAHRWVVSPSVHTSKLKRTSGLFAFVLVCWIGALVLGNIQTRISIAYFDPADFPGDRGLTAGVAYDGVGNNVFALFFGWIFAPICIALAYLFKRKSTEQDAADQSATAVDAKSEGSEKPKPESEGRSQ